MTNCYFIQGPVLHKRNKLIPKTNSYNTGATVTFEGTVRDDKINYKNVVAIDFSTDEETSEKIALEILNVSCKKYGLNDAYIVHSKGKVNAGDTCFMVLVRARHRMEAFKALPEIVNAFKDRVPVFGKEILEDGTHVWKQNK